ncbi:AAA family ATPase [Thiohalocapsa marina]|uniref:AAA family ATPase n=1 Tax=Thiohalocapsa marina TaxID=424902 RepID=A0A5M8FL35_9GAMM|nr:cellulose synthase operon protein YhjQ/BcsQ [Thiohalocapsa marina]KAA6184700.1 AAA family ATPase [Thiohalocapsa marina]
MYLNLEILAVGRSRDTVAAVTEDLHDQLMLALTPLILGDGQLLLPEYMRPLPDALLFCVDDQWGDDVWQVIERIPLPRPPLFMVTSSNEVGLLRTAMRLGVRDVFSMPLNPEELTSAISRVVREERSKRGESGSRLVAFMNTKGGSGSSLIAANVASAMAQEARFSRRILLVDFDFQFGGLPTYLNLVARDGLIKAMEFVDTLDHSALQGYVIRHDSGLHLLAAAMDEIIVPEDVSAARTAKLLDAMNGAYEDILFDLPHRIDASTAAVLERADVIALVAQQSVAHLHDTKRLVFLLRDRLGIATERIVLLVNRYDPKAEVRLEDFEDVFPQLRVRTLPGDYLRASESINLGVPICESAPRSELCRSLQALATGIDKPVAASDRPAQAAGEAPERKKKGVLGLFRR